MRGSGELEVIVEIDTDRSRRNDSGGRKDIYKANKEKNVKLRKNGTV